MTSNQRTTNPFLGAMPVAEMHTWPKTNMVVAYNVSFVGQVEDATRILDEPPSQDGIDTKSMFIGLLCQDYLIPDEQDAFVTYTVLPLLHESHVPTYKGSSSHLLPVDGAKAKSSKSANLVKLLGKKLPSALGSLYLLSDPDYQHAIAVRKAAEPFPLRDKVTVIGTADSARAHRRNGDFPARPPESSDPAVILEQHKAFCNSLLVNNDEPGKVVDAFAPPPPNNRSGTSEHVSKFSEDNELSGGPTHTAKKVYTNGFADHSANPAASSIHPRESFGKSPGNLAQQSATVEQDSELDSDIKTEMKVLHDIVRAAYVGTLEPEEKITVVDVVYDLSTVEIVKNPITQDVEDLRIEEDPVEQPGFLHSLKNGLKRLRQLLAVPV